MTIAIVHPVLSNTVIPIIKPEDEDNSEQYQKFNACTARVVGSIDLYAAILILLQLIKLDKSL